MGIVENYINGLRDAYITYNGGEIWKHFETIKHGVSAESIEELKRIFPFIPKSLLELLSFVDGTYYNEYKGEEITLYFLGSDLNGYPYYLLSAEEMIKNQTIASAYYADYIDRVYGDEDIDEKITDKSEEVKWLHFSDCMNNGGTSQLFIDFSPSKKGQLGQIVRFVHDPDEFLVIAENFDAYLQQLIDNKFNFINEESIER
ncbi:SMI1/KNR4 family protein [Myroides sp. 1354]|uniref:SMI1/KNR4 family protein n=1 Tax=unclassified Myroides TaxID=2642485 RepID=UPI002576F42C|nr:MULTISPECIES: SMI1/KNR4 family protein [unclassified Myroides]MDM1046260.1 SMI1/KNR4 family protein [Myroides sp. R163-1]MDM1057196.1 SMI1/KNR4 family protein [Myroides sp. 1354]MDM1070391.1 SMI1/KNR4 family protein [Myroides sp. 1372]